MRPKSPHATGELPVVLAVARRVPTRLRALGRETPGDVSGPRIGRAGGSPAIDETHGRGIEAGPVVTTGAEPASS